jgi:hypothetical protein
MGIGTWKNNPILCLDGKLGRELSKISVVGVAAAFLKNFIFFLLKFNMVCMFWIVLMC